ncbi:MAG: amino acid permease [Pedobacter sp.]|jgi:APA family basic amino acid/polyamine antiporter
MNDKVKTEASLKRTLGLFASTLMVVGIVIGSGVFKKIVPMAQTGLGETSILMAWGIAGVISLFGAFTVSALASLTEESGGFYEYFRLSFGDFLAFVSGWADFIIISPAAIAALAFLFGEIVNSFAPLPNPLDQWKDFSIGGFIFPFANSGVKLVGIVTIIILTGINSLGSRESGVFNSIITSAKIAGILVLISVGLAYTSPEPQSATNLIHSIKEPGGMLFYSAFFAAMLSAFWAYNGWETATNISGEIINPKRNLPLALTIGLSLVALVYTLLNYTYMNVLSLEQIRAINENQIGAFVVAETLLGTYGKIMLVILLVICVFGALNSNVVTAPRKFFRMAQEGYLFRHMQNIHPKFRTPHVALIYMMILSSIMLISGSFEMLTNMVIFLNFMLYGSLAYAVLRLKRNGTIKIRVVGYPFVPIILLLFSIALTINTIWVQPKQSLMGLLFVFSGVPVYYYFKKQKAS